MYAENLKKLRKELNLTVVKLADAIEVSANTISSYERGLRCPSMDFGIQLYKKLDVNLNWFITGQGEMFNSQRNLSAGAAQKTLASIVDILKQNNVIN